MLDNYTAMFKESIAFGSGNLQGCLRAVRMIPNTNKIEGGVLVAFSYTENYSSTGKELDCKNNA